MRPGTGVAWPRSWVSDRSTFRAGRPSVTGEDGTEGTVSEPRAMKALAKLLGTELPKNPDAGEGYIMF